MSRDKIVAGNWKMNNDFNQTQTLILELKKTMQMDVNVMIAPSFTSLSIAKDLLLDSKIEVVAQNMHFSDSGAFTGEISANMLKSIGIGTVILGHSERRKYFKETDDQLKLKVDAAISSSMKIIFCIGEEIEDRKNNNHFEIVYDQINNSLFHLDEDSWSRIILAYEPVWAIGTGKVAEISYISEMHNFIIEKTKELNINLISLAYGGSVNSSSSKEILSLEEVNGLLIGGASLEAKEFSKIVNSIEN